tara:strand:+ start:912 stop:1802 length:891 start_codon:yes stop_codon:yes gene_type:complete
LNKIILAHISLFLANLIYALNYTIAKDVMPNFIMPSGFILLRVIGAVFLFSISYFFFIKEKVTIKDLFKLSICGLFGVAINQLLFFEGLNLTTPINASIVMTVNPILVLIISFFLIKESITIKKIIGITTGLIGAFILITEGQIISFNSNNQLGNLFVFINAISYGLYLVTVKPLMRKYHPITVMFYVFGFGLLYVFYFGFEELSDVRWSEIPITIYYSIAFVVFCTTFLAYLFNSLSLKKLNPSTVSIYIYFQPLLASIFAIFKGADTLNNTKLIAAIFIFIGVYLVSVKSNREY